MDQKYVKKTCDEANSRFISEALSGYPKYKYLPQWLMNKSFYLSNERSKPQDRYRVLKRGAIIYVDFGINVGYELSGNHFAIVLNNHDNPKNGNLTVVPISSKKKSNYVPVGKILEIQSIKHFISQSDKILEKLRVVVLASVAQGILDYDSLPQTVLDVIDKGAGMTPEEAIKKAKKMSLVCDSAKTLQIEVGNLMTESDQHRKVFNTYRKYTKDSYAMPLNIQTISKKRIKQINRFDPSGRIKAPADVLTEIDKAIKNRFTKL